MLAPDHNAPGGSIQYDEALVCSATLGGNPVEAHVWGLVGLGPQSILSTDAQFETKSFHAVLTVGPKNPTQLSDFQSRSATSSTRDVGLKSSILSLTPSALSIGNCSTDSSGNTVCSVPLQPEVFFATIEILD